MTLGNGSSSDFGGGTLLETQQIETGTLTTILSEIIDGKQSELELVGKICRLVDESWINPDCETYVTLEFYRNGGLIARGEWNFSGASISAGRRTAILDLHPPHISATKHFTEKSCIEFKIGENIPMGLREARTGLIYHLKITEVMQRLHKDGN